MMTPPPKNGEKRGRATPAGLSIRRPRRRSQIAETVHAAWSYGRTKVGVWLLVLICAIAFVGPFLPYQSPNEFGGVPFQAPSSAHWLGLDGLGRDVLARLLHGGVSVVLLASIATVLGVGVGALAGILAGYTGGRTDSAIMRGTDLLLAFPQLVFALLLLSVFGSDLWLITLAVAVTHAPRVARVARGATVEVRENNYIKSSEALGVAHWRIVVADVLPVISSPLLAEFGLRLTWSIGLVASIGFLGLGLQPPASDWGLMINENRIGIASQPWAVLAPVILIALLTIGANLVTDGLARALVGIDRKMEST